MNHQVKTNLAPNQEEKFEKNHSKPKDFKKTLRKVNIQCKNIFKIYKQGNLEVVALKKVNVSIYAGEIVIIMGPSGSGKTTLLNCMAGLERPTAGKVLVKDYDVTKLNDFGIETLLQDEVGIVFQFFNLIPSLTARANVELPMIIAKKKAVDINKRAEELFKQIDLENRASHRPTTLSGGEKQRIAIAMAFANDPSVVLADEPTGNVDSISGQKVLNIFTDYIKDNPEKSIVIVTHDHNLRKIADRTLVLKDGRIIRELGKDESHLSLEEEGEDELTKIYQYAKDESQVEALLNPKNRVIDFDEVLECTNCGSEHIRKMYDKDAGDYKIRNEQLITRASVSCDQCHSMNYITVSIKNMIENL